MFSRTAMNGFAEEIESSANLGFPWLHAEGPSVSAYVEESGDAHTHSVQYC